MKPSELKQNPNPKKGVGAVRGSLPVRGLPMTGLPKDLPMEWMDPMSWRLPSGKALAEFALQAGFLAPLILSGPRAQPVTGQTVIGKTTGAAEDGGENLNHPGFGKPRVPAR